MGDLGGGVGGNRLWEVTERKDGGRSEVRAELGNVTGDAGLDLTGWMEAAGHRVPPGTRTPVFKTLV